VLAAVVPHGDRVLLSLHQDDGTPAGPARSAPGPAELAAIESVHRPRWLFDAAADDYPALLAAGIRLRRCQDIALTERILLGRVGRFGEPCRTAAVLARMRGAPVPDDPAPKDPQPAGRPAEQPGLFDTDRREQRPAIAPDDLVTAYVDQQRRITDCAVGPSPTAAGIAVPAGALRLLIAAESGSALVAAEMTRRGLPWDAAVHERILADTLGPRPPAGARPARMAELAARITEAFGFPVNPDSPVDLRDAFRRAGFDIDTTRAWVLRDLDHPAVEPVLQYKDLARLFTANGWNWLADWVSGGRLVSEYLPGGVVSGRWATRGGGALQLPKVVRRAAVARPGHVMVVADAAQLEPRVLAAVSGDAALAAVSAGADLYAGLAADGFGGDRRHAKLAMLGAMYGQTTGEAARLMATLRVRYPAAVEYVEAAARRGESGGVVRSVLGRACPPPSAGWRRLVAGWSAGDGEASGDSGPGGPGGDPADGGSGGDGAAAGFTDEPAGRRDAPAAARSGVERRARQAARDRGRFTRNFVIQASAADWAAVWLSQLRLGLMDVPDAELVFFQHDELIVHVPAEHADTVSALVVSAADTARELVFPGSVVQTPVRPVVVQCYADAK
jgi:DNA polymerase-1